MSRWSPPWLRQAGLGAAGPSVLRVAVYDPQYTRAQAALLTFARTIGSEDFDTELGRSKTLRDGSDEFMPKILKPTYPSGVSAHHLHRAFIETSIFNEAEVGSALTELQKAVHCVLWAPHGRPFPAHAVSQCRLIPAGQTRGGRDEPSRGVVVEKKPSWYDPTIDRTRVLTQKKGTQ